MYKLWSFYFTWINVSLFIYLHVQWHFFFFVVSAFLCMYTVIKLSQILTSDVRGRDVYVHLVVIYSHISCNVYMMKLFYLFFFSLCTSHASILTYIFYYLLSLCYICALHHFSIVHHTYLYSRHARYAQHNM